MTKEVILNNRYKLTKLLGTGGTAEVFLAYDQVTQKAVAIKIIKQELLANGVREHVKPKKRLQRELNISARLEHPDIIVARDTGEYQGRPYVVMDYIEGIPLSHLILVENLGLGFVIELTKRICDILDYAHKLGVIHRDLKPSNIFITPEGKPKILDFGLALDTTYTEKITDAFSIVGTHFYMAPEQALSSTVDHRADLYSLGVILYEMVTGCKPFVGKGRMTIVMQHLNTPPKPPSLINPEIPPKLEEIILKLLAKNSDDRFSSAGELKAALEKINLVEEKSFKPPGKISFPDYNFPLQGRERKMEIIITQAEEVFKENTPHIVIVTGEEGIGKTRLLNEIEAYAKLSRFLYISSTASIEKKFFYGYFLEDILEDINLINQNTQYLRALGISFEKLMQLFQKYRKKFLTFLIPTPFDLQTKKEEKEKDFVTLTIKLISEITQIRPLILALDPIPLGDPFSLKLIQNLLKSQFPLLIITTLEDKELSSNLNNLKEFNNLASNYPVRTVTLKELAEAEVAKMCEILLASEKISKEVIDKINKVAKGNPLKVQELLRYLIDNDFIVQKDDKWQFEEGINKLPEKLEILLNFRINKLEPRLKQLLEIASAFGENFNFTELIEYAKLNPDLTRNLLKQAIRSGILSYKSSITDRYYFDPPVIREIIYYSISPKDRERLHSIIAEQIEKKFTYPALPLLSRLSYHYWKGKKKVKMKEYISKMIDIYLDIGEIECSNRLKEWLSQQ